MKYLLDSCAFLWMLKGTLDEESRDLLSPPDVLLCFSAVSAWEIEIKRQTEKLQVAKDWDSANECQKHGIYLLDLNSQSVGLLGTLPALHKNPFERLLICQAIFHNYCLVTSNQKILEYGDCPDLKLRVIEVKEKQTTD